ncbi:U-box domain-containing protein 6-like [Phalaenopsis equestris]|uniref:U-box domain-containing protein 6-like n=1 Tax=Phalaenopsis equestris TaxID=78828 RepID=UPI0009E5EC5E|nr:U-box domain-containing protein 6-like [Phalaenopsis equestris]
MDVADQAEENLAVSDAKLHGGMCRQLSAILYKVLAIFPVLEGARPRSKSGIQALCSLHVTLDKSKNILQHCSECSKLYLAITGDSILMKFEKARCALQESLMNAQDIVPQAIGCQIMEIVGELERTVFILDHADKKAGEEVLSLLQEKKNSETNSNDGVELKIFHQAMLKLGITSSRAALSERRALCKLIERARAEEDKHKESIVAYLLLLTRKYSKLFRNDIPEDSDSQGSNPCSPTLPGPSDGSSNDFARESSFSSKLQNKRSEEAPTPPEEFRCPISLQIMHEPAIISSGQTYERVCIEKWFKDGHNTCPKTQQKLTHFSLTPNFCVKSLIASWCQQNGLPVPDGPPESLELKSWRLFHPANDTIDSRSIGGLKSCDEGVESSPPEKSGGITGETNNGDTTESEDDEFERYESLLKLLRDSMSRRKRQKAIEEIRGCLKKLS